MLRHDAPFPPPGVINVKSYGAAGDGTTDDTLAIQATIDACTAQGGGTVWVPEGTYLLSQQGTAWGSQKYCVRPTASAAPVIIQGAGKGAIFTLALHQHGSAIWFMFLFNKLTGSVLIQDLQFTIPAPVTPGVTPGQGPCAISYGELGGTSESGSLTEIIVQRCGFTNPSFFFHGEGAGRAIFRDNTGIAKGGGLYPTYFCEPIDLGARTATQTTDVLIENNKFTNDPTYGDHCVYTLGTFSRIVVRNNQFDAVNHDLLKFDGGGIAGGLTGAIIVEDNIDTRTSYLAGDGQGFSVWMILSAPAASPTVGLLRVVGNRVKYAYQFLYTEWGIQEAEISNNDAQYTEDAGLALIKNTTVGLVGNGLIANNNFDNGGVSPTSTNFIKPECFTQVAIICNKARGLGNTRFISNGELANQLKQVCFGNDSNLSVSWIANHNGTNLIDIGNSWNPKEFADNAAPTGGTWAVGDRVWDTGVTAGGRMGWVCTTAGTPGTWTDFYDLSSGTQTIDGAKTLTGGLTLTTANATITDINVVLGTTTGTKFGTATTQKLSFFNSTPIVQPTSTTDLRTALINLGLIATGGATPLNLNGGALTAAAGNFSGNLAVTANEIRTTSTAPQTYWKESDASADNKTWAVVVNGEVWKLRLFNDAEGVAADIFSIARSGTTVGTITIGGATTQATNWAQTGATTWSSGTGVSSHNCTTDATALGTAADVFLGGTSVAKTTISGKGQGWGVTNTATHNGATTLVQGSTIVQNFTGTTAGEIPTMPAANLWGAGIGVVYIIINSSNQTITPTRAGSDTFQGGGTTSAILAGGAMIFISDGVSVWLKASVS
jgi:hypothetical protein